MSVTAAPAGPRATDIAVPAVAGAGADAGGGAGAGAGPARRRRASLQRQNNQGSFVFALVVVAAVVVMVVGLTRLSSAVDDQTARWGPAVIQANALLAALLDQETGVRGFAVTADPSYLDPYTSGFEDELVALRGLRSLVPADDSAARAALDAFAAAGDTWRQQFAAPLIAAVQAGNRATVDRLVSTESGKQLFDTVRARYADLETDLSARRTAAVAQVRSSVSLLVTTASIAAVVVLAATVGGWWSTRRRIITPVARLAADSRIVAGGDLEHRVGGGGPAEIDDLAHDVEDMRRRIVGELAEVERARAVVESTAASLARSNADLEQFAYVASHDLQEPLRKVSNFCQLLQRQYGPQLDDRAGQYIHFAVDGAKRMQVLINDLLSFSRVGRNADTFAEVALAEVVREALDNLAEPVRDSGAIVSVADDLPVVRAERTLLVTLLQNLLGNAVKYRGEATPEVRVTAVRREAAVPPGVEAAAPRYEWQVSVADNGIGIDPQYAQRIFVIFQRLHLRDSYGGTGIGLAMCKKIVEFHGGTIWLEPSEPPGATFCFTLPEGSPA